MEIPVIKCIFDRILKQLKTQSLELLALRSGLEDHKKTDDSDTKHMLEMILEQLKTQNLELSTLRSGLEEHTSQLRKVDGEITSFSNYFYYSKHYESKK